MGNVRNFAFSADPREFMSVQNKTDEIAKQYPGFSRSLVWKTLLIEVLGVEPLDPDMHKVYLNRINKALGKQENK